MAEALGFALNNQNVAVVHNHNIRKLVTVLVGFLRVENDRLGAKYLPQPLRHLTLQPSALGSLKSLPVVCVRLQIEPESLEQRGPHERRHKEKILTAVMNQRPFIKG